MFCDTEIDVEEGGGVCDLIGCLEKSCDSTEIETA